jgi:molybdate transport system substrate-binding protein
VGRNLAWLVALLTVLTGAIVGGSSVGAQEASPRSKAAIPTCGATGAMPVTNPAPAVAATSPADATGRDELTVFAAASLRNAFESFEPAYEALSEVDLVYAFDASSVLRTQIEEGAPADVFASADIADALALIDAGLATDPVSFACNELAVIVPAANPAGIETAADLARPGIRVVAAGKDVPITRYATELVAALGIAEGYAYNVVSTEDNVAAVRAKIELGEGDAAVVYATDAIASGDLVTRIPVPAEANIPATYAAVIVSGTDQPDEAHSFLAWLTGPEGQAALARFGFLPHP